MASESPKEEQKLMEEVEIPEENEQENHESEEAEEEDEENPEETDNNNNNNAEENNNNNNDESTDKDSSPGKIFVGGLPKNTSTEAFTKHFKAYGEITDSVIMKSRVTGMPRGFGFVTYADPSVVEKVIQDKHVFDGREVEIKRTIPKSESTGKGSRGSTKTKKIFVGGIPTSMTEAEFKDHFSKFGKVEDHQIMHDRTTGRSRGFGFVTFESEATVDEIISKGSRMELGGKMVELKKAEPKKPDPPIYRNDSRAPFVPAGPMRDGFGAYGGPPYGGNMYPSGGYGRTPGYAGYGAAEYGRGYGAYGGGYGDEVARGYGPRGGYGDGFSGYGANMMSSYGSRGEGYLGYGDAGYGSSAYEGRGAGGSYGSTNGYSGGRGYGGGSSSGRYHPYASANGVYAPTGSA